MTSIEIIVRDDDGKQFRKFFPNVKDVKDFQPEPKKYMIGFDYDAVPPKEGW